MPIPFLALCTGLLVPTPSLMAAPTVFTQQTIAPQKAAQQTAATSAVFPSYEVPSVMLAKVFKPEDIKKPERTPEEEEIAKQEARVKGLLIVLLSALPSLYAQDKLVWEKERAGIQVFGSKDSKKKAKKATKGK